MKMKYFHQTQHTYGNLMWPEHGTFPMNGGKFPSNHPIDGAKMIFINTDYVDDGSKFYKLHKMGYSLSCFPEGDGMVINGLNGQSPDKVIEDVVEVFGFDIVKQ